MQGHQSPNNKRPLKKLEIKGGYPLNGSVKISGSKNAALPMMTASILSDDDITLNGIPDLADVKTLITLLDSMGIKAKKTTKVLLHLMPVKLSQNLHHMN